MSVCWLVSHLLKGYQNGGGGGGWGGVVDACAHIAKVAFAMRGAIFSLNPIVSRRPSVGLGDANRRIRMSLPIFEEPEAGSTGLDP